MPQTLRPNTIRLYTRDTPEGRDIYPVMTNERIPRTQTSTWPRRVVTGPVSADSEEYLSSWTQDDYSGGRHMLFGWRPSMTPNSMRDRSVVSLASRMPMPPE